MAIQGFVISDVELGGPGPGLHPACGLAAESVEVRIGTEEFLTRHPVSREVTFTAPCSAKIGSLACDVCRLGELRDMTDFDVGFSVERTGASMHSLQPSLLRAVKRALPGRLADALDCDRENGQTAE